MTENGTTNRNHQQGLDPPSFQLPQEWDESRYELWSVRVPVSLPVDMLDGKMLEVPSIDDTAGDQQTTVMGSFKNDDSHYAIVSGHTVENEAFRVLQPIQKDDNSEEDESDNDQNKMLMIPSSVRFSRHINVVDGSTVEEIVDTELAPRLEVAPTPEDPLRRAYAPVPQRSGLKRRWMPPGVSCSGTMSILTSATVAVPSPPVDDAKPPSRKKKQKRHHLPPEKQSTEVINSDKSLQKYETTSPRSTSTKEQSEFKEQKKPEKKSEKKAKKEKKKKEKKAKKKKKHES